jgi:lipopolysaccharide transport system ATP-binding protein
MSDVIIKVENISKLYRLGEVGTGTLNQDIKRWWAKTRGKEDPFTKIGETNDRTKKGQSDFVWALKDIDFEVKRGDLLGIIGRNGAGKSTLLKILSKITAPSKGCIKIKGRIASLLEVGTGFNPDLTGRENIFLNGAILGMSKSEIKRKFDEIVDFSGVERYIDTPVKRYSSGMYVRLAFAVAAHLESEIMILDEVLAVGDAEFQKKCLGKIGDVSKGEGRTILFVSHNIQAINSLTNKCVYLKNGQLVKTGPTEEIVEIYQGAGETNTRKNNYFEKQNLNLNKPIELISCSIATKEKSNLNISINYAVRKKIGSVVAVKITNKQGVVMMTLRDTDKDMNLFMKFPGSYNIQFEVPIAQFAPNIYKITFSFSDMKSERFDFFEDLLSFEIDTIIDSSSFAAKREGVLHPVANSFTKKIEGGKVSL